MSDREPAAASAVLAAVKGLEGERTALFEVLAARGFAVAEQARQRILACLEPAQLKRWLRRAVSVRNPEELFEP